MDETIRHHKENPIVKANFLSRIFFCWINPLFKTGHKRPLEVEDMYDVVPEDASSNLGNDLEREWEKELQKSKELENYDPSLVKALFRCFGLRYSLLGLIVLIEEGTKVVQPLLLGALLRFFTPNPTITQLEAYMFAVGVSMCATSLAISHHPYFFNVCRIGMKMRIACCSLMYKKSLKLSNKALGETTTGQIVNLMSNDVNRFDQAVIFLHFLWVGPLQALAVLVILWHELGPAVLAGFAVLLLLIPMQACMGKLFSKLRHKTAKHTDERVRLMNEIISGMRVIKMYCWEKPFGDLVEKVRKMEVCCIQRARNVQALILGPFFVSSKLVVWLIVLAVTFTGHALGVEQLYIALGVIQAIRLSVTLFVPFAVQSIAEVKVCLQRFEDSLTVIGMSSQKAERMQHVYLVLICFWDFLDLSSQFGFGRDECYTQSKFLRVEAIRDSCVFFGNKLLLLLLLVPYFMWNAHPTSAVVFMTALYAHNVSTLSMGLVSEALEQGAVGFVTYHRFKAFRHVFVFSGSKILLLPLLVPYFLWNKHPTSRAVFMTVLYATYLRLSWMIFMSDAIAKCAIGSVVFDRLKKFLMLEELEKPATGQSSGLRPKPENCHVTLENITAKWDEKVDQNTLENISACVRAGQLLAVIGPVGAGKSSLLMAILGELPLREGKVKCQGKIAYVAQQAWVFSASLRQNIIFGNTYEKKKYERILKACALNRDITIMPHGDATLIGDRGVSLSGGQRARASLARALYTDADVYLLDDPLSAVDAAVGQHIFKRCIMGELANKPRILVTHQLQYLQEADQILILKEGQMLGMGTFNELARSGVDFSSLLKVEEQEEEKVTSAVSMEGIQSSVGGPNEIGSTLSLVSIKTEFEPEPVQLPEQEIRQEGNVGLGVFYQYFKAGAGCLFFLLLVFVNLAAQVAYIMSDWWLSRWSNQEEIKYAAIEKHENLLEQGYNQTNVTIPIVPTMTNVYIFSGIISAVFLFGLLRALLFFKMAVTASQVLHNRMFERILRTPISFFDTNPVGRILNRFSKDVGHMDDLLPITFFDFIQCSLLILGIVAVAGVVNPWVFIPTVPLCGLFILVRKYYLSTSRSVKRLEGTTRSPVFSHLSASLQGLSTIRAFGMQQRFVHEFDSHQDLHTQSWFLFLCTSRWFAVRLDWLCTIFITAVTFCSIPMAGSLNAGLVGLSITYAMTLMGLFQWGVRQSAEVENQMISVERVLEYTKLPQEADMDSSADRKPPPDWPQNGTITGKSVCLRYSPDGPQVLNYLTFDIQAKEKVGIVGRTGAGKSSLIAMLFRLVEPEGSLYIDSIDIMALGLHDLRRAISIIPQDPVLFTGSLRRNLDPFQQHEDAALWQALSEVELKPAVEDLPGALDALVSEGGINFSVGQRQLICLARAILRQNRILLIDEATANVDPKTDALIQQTIREKFQNCTVLTIAHRLNTIMDSDRVLVLDEGRIMEFDVPHKLLEQGEGYFVRMVEQMGHAEADALAEVASMAYARRCSLDPSLDQPRDSNAMEKMAMAGALEICHSDDEGEMTTEKEVPGPEKTTADAVADASEEEEVPGEESPLLREAEELEVATTSGVHLKRRKSSSSTLPGESSAKSQNGKMEHSNGDLPNCV